MIQWGINKDQQQIRRYTGRTKGKTYIEPTNLNRSKKIKENNSTKNQWGSTTKPQSQEANSHSQEQKRKKKYNHQIRDNIQRWAKNTVYLTTTRFEWNIFQGWLRWKQIEGRWMLRHGRSTRKTSTTQMHPERISR